MTEPAAFPRIDVITGPMFSGKTTALLTRLTTLLAANKKILYINFRGDTRSEESYSTHSPLVWLLTHSNFSAIKIDTLSCLFTAEFDQMVNNADVIGIDEAQFFPDIYDKVVELCEIHHKHVIVGALSGDFNRNLMGDIYRLLPIADNWSHLKAICKRCHDEYNRNQRPALFSHLTISHTTNDSVIIGGADKYVSLCRECYLDLKK